MNLDRNTLRLTTNWTGRTPRTLGEAFPQAPRTALAGMAEVPHRDSPCCRCRECTSLARRVRRLLQDIAAKVTQ